MKRILLLLYVMISAGTVFAADNVLQTIEIEPVKDTYNIVLTTDKAVDVKKTIESEDKITLNLKDIRVSKTLNTVYNNASEVDTVLVEPQGNGVNIYFQAENASNATITFDAPVAIAPVASIPSQKLKLSNPIESYAPVYKEDLGNVKTSNLFDRLKSSSTVADLKDSIDEGAASGDNANKFITWGLLTLFGVAVIRLFKRKEPEMKIGLSQSLNDRDAGRYAGFQTVPVTAMAEKPFTTVNYGLNAYRNENRNPYEQAPMQLNNPRLRNYVSQPMQNTITQTVSRPEPQPAAVGVQTQPKKMTTPVNTAPVNQSNPNIDNLKFLDSMAAIYEKSGRHDLAKGLKASLGRGLK